MMLFLQRMLELLLGIDVDRMERWQQDLEIVAENDFRMTCLGNPRRTKEDESNEPKK